MTTPVTIVQAGDVAVATSGSPITFFAANSTPGNSAAVFILNTTNTADDISSVTSSMGTFVRVVDQGGSPLIDFEWWVCLKITGASKVITITSASGQGPAVQVTEWSPIGGALPGPATNSTGTAVTSTITAPLIGAALLVGTGAFGVYSAGPTSPWTNYDTGEFINANGQGVAYQTAATLTAQTATWTQTSSLQWQTLGLILTPVTPRPVLAMQAVQRASVM